MDVERPHFVSCQWRELAEYVGMSSIVPCPHVTSSWRITPFRDCPHSRIRGATSAYLSATRIERDRPARRYTGASTRVRRCRICVPCHAIHGRSSGPFCAYFLGLAGSGRGGAMEAPSVLHDAMITGDRSRSRMLGKSSLHPQCWGSGERAGHRRTTHAAPHARRPRSGRSAASPLFVLESDLPY
jgi:hypothetical protein